MPRKSEIVEYLGQSSLLTAELARDALRANERAKPRMTALRAALVHARDAAAMHF